MLKKIARMALYVTIATPLLIPSLANAEQSPSLTEINVTPIATSTTAFDLSHSSISRDSLLIPLNINTASKLELTALSGIGEQKALRIIEWRERHGEFKSTAELSKIKGIGKATVARLASSITATEQ
ncbi:helix-hairpin-helix domain-containing protein [Moritella sp. 24]|uniref:ComEA family DNA-binding protein n=1 Tax=Moritella sp. 24 TaxID=2746230 RepID=UPI001BAD3573|nr:helix-hairpin-helix domain-containing protein [Moritella sp. 24]QUM77278.1 helix-hairpin-helix domain-containing protein [Moritella sp. 24]